MSKSKERAEKICLNCNAELIGRYCHNCGQENIEPKDTVWGIVHHFFSDITHFDGKFFSTLKHLIRKPGFLSSEYIKGRRASYLNPIRMYVFTASFFFVVFFSMFNIKKSILESKRGTVEFSPKDVAELKKEAISKAKSKRDSAAIDSGFSFLKGFATTPFADTSTKKTRDTIGGLKFSIGGYSGKFKSIHEYDSAQKTLPADERDGWFVRMINHKVIDISVRYGNNTKQFFADLLNSFIHTFPYLLFVSLPLYALYLKLLYIRRKRFFYVDHGIFLIHLYIYSFIFMLAFFSLDKLKVAYHLRFLNFIQVIFVLYGIYYVYRAMRNFYGQGRFKTFAKFALLNMLAYITMLILFVLFFSISLFQL